jgi:adenine/guanine phosphoribosyltransferase-like PRPP-binding protein
VDDCLASGGTLDAMHRLVTAQGGTIRNCVGVMELPDLHGREKAPLGTEIFTLMQFRGQ